MREKQKILLPGQTIGILGGGQLGRMVILEGRKMGYRFVTLDPAVDCPGGQVADEHIVGAYDDLLAVERLAELSDVIIYEFENLDPELVRRLEQKKRVPQGSRLLEICRHRLKEKRTLEHAGAPVARYTAVETKDDVISAIGEVGFPSVLKTTTGGYDGKGQWMLKSSADVKRLPPEMFTQGRSYILEQFVPFSKELSVVVARSSTGETSAFPPVVNLHRHHILHMSVAPAPVSAEIAAQAEKLAIRIAEHLQVVGLIAVEMFLLENGNLLVNELAPRPHNSGHYTYDACYTSQFEQLIRAVLGMPLGPSDSFSPAVMVNVLGEHTESFMRERHCFPSEVKVHWYGKKEVKTARKMGHVTIVADTAEKALEIVREISIWPPLTDQEENVIKAETRKLQEVGRSE
ncbi:5-(carboxyamino)imidazole ribonucleotide synthase [Paenactinomyces guangxiensis]|uniref:N5-carboxyaminoimidazole ribonucleotide synthase n=1 Tax=Paenactinomyces guangxiensis TaxID=1490290 RepID=A0A7W1WT38_9BACL|nr:5-(carboxyamino)imidazole ribonucleotide synthase [Paenactinomyces guangxiensis]MBA4495492.1 5-(carboxyamino)imidazole ribonucleotide synthase [Paenactinomyces guangxiensis]MBH8592385.1 5-(carboxyamino)imidazole ribonucleotide synthase [Paenactinomyces guangxiensis]